MATGIPEVLTQRTTSKWGVILKSSRIGGRGGNNGGIVHGTLLLEYLNDGRYRGGFLANRNVNTIDRVASFVVGTLIDDRIDGDGRLSCLAVTNNQLALATANGNHGIDGLQSCLQRFFDGLTENDPGSLTLKGHFSGGVLNGAFAIQGIAQGVNDPAQQTFTGHDGSNLTRTLHGVVLLHH